MRDRHGTRTVACRAAVRAFRSRRVLPASLTASLLAVAGGLATVHIVSNRIGHPVFRPRATAGVVRLLHTLTWGDRLPMAAGGVLAFAGLLLVLAAVLPGRTRTAALAGDDPRFVTGLGRASLRAALVAAAREVPGVDTASARLRGRLRPRAEVRVATGSRDPEELGEQVTVAVCDRLADLAPVRPPLVTVRVAERRKES